MENEKLKFWMWFFSVVIIGGILGYRHNHPIQAATKRERLSNLFFGVVTSMFVGYIVFQLAFYYLGNDNVAVSLAGLAAWMGTNALIALESVIVMFISKKKV